ncbi:rhodanese-like domain-containing protein [Petroclostridium sp. X23]|uniref:rhodanese-like domain-containing protein n=1 Tax=Petroclostridium sp. X23 TaxID=3045146 RepID=UPI0024AC9A29|nr:rhodanese-like domain-containing protein [Petroclostridium sp. X23]WHH61486.1 rhodanese-like domain-containing protein [Petroclostridium sp. X23]
MNRITVLFMVVIMSASFVACANKGLNTGNKSTQNSNKYQKISPSEAKQRLEEEEGIILLDVRTEEEYQEKHIPQSVLIPLEILEKEMQDKIPDKNTVIFVYCRSGRRSANASEILVSLGYTNIYDLGGIQDWPYDIEKGD